jgi:hypothetical protein
MQVQYSAAGNISYVPSGGYKRVKVLLYSQVSSLELTLISMLVIFPSIFYSLIILSLTRS